MSLSYFVAYVLFWGPKTRALRRVLMYALAGQDGR